MASNDGSSFGIRDPIHNIIYSLPAIAHSLGIAKRSPTFGFTQKSKYMPDYGGILEVPNSSLKNNALDDQLPFKINSTNFNEIALNRDLDSNSPGNDCLVLSSIDDENALVIRAIGKTLYLNYLERDFTDHSYSSNSISSLQCSDSITGLKLSSDRLIIKFPQSQRLLKLNQILISNPESEIPDGKYFQNVATISETNGMDVKDSCINNFNHSILGIASDHISSAQVKIYDISDSRNPFLTISWDYLEDSSYIQESEDTILDKSLRRRSIRTFKPIKPAIRGIQQFEKIPSHLTNMFVSTDYKTSLIDPRMDKIAQVYVDRSKISTFYPIEYLRRSVFSIRNSYQFYSLTNVHLRVFDTRYPQLPVNQVNHMLDSDSYKNLHMKLINYKRNDSIDTLCCSAGNRISFLSFDQSSNGNLINPKSVHQPYHDDFDQIVDSQHSRIDSQDKAHSLFGLDLWESRNQQDGHNNILFSVIQLSNFGNITTRDYFRNNTDNEMENVGDLEDRAEFIISQTRNKFSNSQLDNARVTNEFLDITERDILESDISRDNQYINILDSNSLVAIENNFASSRARERFLKMKDNLTKVQR